MPKRLSQLPRHQSSASRRFLARRQPDRRIRCMEDGRTSLRNSRNGCSLNEQTFTPGQGGCMATIQAQMWKGSNFTIEQVPATKPQTAVFRFTGPFTARDMFQSLTPAEMRQLLEPASCDGHTVQVLDLTAVPYMDSAGLGIIVSHYVRCQAKG